MMQLITGINTKDDIREHDSKLSWSEIDKGRCNWVNHYHSIVT